MSICTYAGNACHIRVLEARNLKNTQGWGGTQSPYVKLTTHVDPGRLAPDAPKSDARTTVAYHGGAAGKWADEM
jgi:hypothetical protein